MSTMREQFEAFGRQYGLWLDVNAIPQQPAYNAGWTKAAWAAWQAATEAAKATGTAGEQKPRAWLIEYEYLAGVTLKGEGLRRTENWAKASFVSDSKNYADHPDFEQEGTRNIVVTPLLPAEAARQPAPVVAVKTWQERVKRTDDATAMKRRSIVARDEEIADLRAALAATNRSQPEKQRAAHCPNCGAHGKHLCSAGSQP